MPHACIVFNLIPVIFGENVRILHVTGSILENPVRTRYRVNMCLCENVFSKYSTSLRVVAVLNICITCVHGEG